MSHYLLATAEVEWQGDTPRSRSYDDIYWHPGRALEEKTHVFTAPLRRRLEQLRHRQALQLTVGELGFGFGVNFLLTASLWCEMPGDGVLTYISVEKHPVTLADLARYHRLLRHQQGVAPALLEALREAWLPPVAGQHTLWLADRVRLILIFGDAAESLSELDAQADAWFLDGFAPSRNAAMWSHELLHLLFARSRPGALVSSYSVAGAVRRGLSQAGFLVTKEPGFGSKQEMLMAYRRGEWRPRHKQAPSLVIAGAGLAGHFCAEAAARHGLAAKLVGGRLGNPSDIPQLAVFPQLATKAEARHRFSLAAFLYMKSAPGMKQTGVVQAPRNQAEKARLQAVAELFPDELIEWRDGCLHFHQAGWWALGDFAQALGLNAQEGFIKDISRDGDAWLCRLQGGETLAAEALILATGQDTSLTGNIFGLRAVRGQALSLPSAGLEAVTTGTVTIFPTDLSAGQGRSVISGSYARSRDPAPWDKDTEALLAAAQAVQPSLAAGREDMDIYVGIRAAARDRLPLVGAVPTQQALDQAVPGARQLAEHQPGLFICNGFGSRGATHARLCAEQLISQILGEASPLSRPQLKMLSPARFALRDSRPNNQEG